MGQVDLLPFGYHTMEIGCIFLRQFHQQNYALEALHVLAFEYASLLNKSQSSSACFLIKRSCTRECAKRDEVERRPWQGPLQQKEDRHGQEKT